MSHEIRTPLGAIVGLSGLLSAMPTSNDEGATFVERIARNANQLSHLIDDLLDLSKIEANKLDVEYASVDLQRAIEDALAAFSERVVEKGIKLTAAGLSDIPRIVKTDATRLRQILMNLIGNAVKFTPSGHITVHFSIVMTRAKRFLTVKIIDTGIGLTPEQQARIFEPFMQADSSITRKFGGTGLGLALSRELARLLGGDITLEKSVPGEGSTFVLTIDLGLAAADGAAGKTTGSIETIANPNLKHKRILIVDDAPDNRALVSRFLQVTEATCETAFDGQDAVEKVRANSFDLILMDLQMPRLDGYHAVVTLRADGFTMPIVALTAHALKEERLRCLDAGFNDYVTKPINSKSLIRIVSDLISKPPT